MDRRAYLDELERLQAGRNARSAQEVSRPLAFVLQHGAITDAVLATRPRSTDLGDDDRVALRALTPHLEDSWQAFLSACRDALTSAHPDHPLTAVAIGTKVPTRPTAWLRRRWVVDKLRAGKLFQLAFLAQREEDEPSYTLTATVWTDRRRAQLPAEVARDLSLDRVTTGVADGVGCGSFRVDAREGARMSEVARQLVRGIWPLAEEVYRRML